jgi:hypothetical protein
MPRYYEFKKVQGPCVIVPEYKDRLVKFGSFDYTNFDTTIYLANGFTGHTLFAYYWDTANETVTVFIGQNPHKDYSPGRSGCVSMDPVDYVFSEEDLGRIRWRAGQIIDEESKTVYPVKIKPSLAGREKFDSATVRKLHVEID